MKGRLARGVCAAAVVTLLTAARSANAGGCDQPRPIAGTQAYRLAAASMATNAQTFNAVNALERHVFPVLNLAEEGRKKGDNEVKIVWATETNFLWNAVKVPTYEGEAGDCSGNYRYAMRGMDLGAQSWVLGARAGGLGLFIGGSVTYSRLGQEAFTRYAAAPWALFGYSIVPILAAPFKRIDYQNGITTLASDVVLGVSLHVPGIDGRLGLIASKGVYANLGQPQTRLFAGAVLGDEYKRLLYLRSGFRDIATGLGLTSLYARMLPLTALQQFDAAGNVVESDAVRTRFMTAHLEQLNIGKLIDVTSAIAWEPSPMLHEARVAIHTEGYRPAPAKPKDLDKEQYKAEPFGIIATAGIVRMPPMWYYGQEGGNRLSLRVDMVGTAFDEKDKDFPFTSRVLIGLRYNEPEVLSVFPYARNAWDLYISFQAWN